MRVMVLHNRYRSDQPSGENAVVEDETALLESAGVDVHPVVVSNDAIIDRRGVRLIGAAGRATWSRSSARFLARAIAEVKPDVLHVHNTFPRLSDSVLWQARQSGVPVVQTIHNFRSLCANALLLRDGRPCELCIGKLGVAGVTHRCYRGSAFATAPIVFANTVHRVLRTHERCVDRVIAPSEFLREVFVRAGWPSARMTVRQNSCPDPGLAYGPRAGVVCVARFSPEKGVDDLLDGWNERFRHRSEVLTLVGDGPERQRLEAKARRSSNVRFIGLAPRAAVSEYLSKASAVVVPSRCYEVSPRVVAKPTPRVRP